MSLSIRAKIILLFSLVGALIVGGSSWAGYLLLKSALTQSMSKRIQDIALTGAAGLNTETLQKLEQRLSPNLPPAQVSRVEQSPEYKQISDQLNAIRQVEPELIHFAYIMVPGEQPNLGRFVVDADLLADRENIQQGNIPPNSPLSGFDQPFDVSSADMRFLRQAMTERRLMVEPEPVYDQEYQTRSLSAYAPIFSADGKTFLGVLGLDMSDENMRATLEKITLGFMAITAGGVIVLFLAMFLAGSFVTRGIQDLVRVLEHGAALPGAADWAEPPQGKSQDPRSGFRAMAQAVAGIIAGADWLHKETLLHKQHEQDLTKAMHQAQAERETAKKAIRQKNRFVSLLAHDIRSPVSAMMVMAETLKLDDHPLSPEQEETVNRIRVRGESFLKMVDELVRFTQMQGESPQMDLQWFSPLDIIQEVLTLGVLGARKGITLENKLESHHTLFADPVLFREVLQNLVVNAIKFCRPGDTITLAMVDPQTLIVTDTGPGISPDILPNLFREDVRTTTLGSQGEVGSGLGLPLAHQIMSAMGGSIQVESIPGKGAVFLLRFPTPHKK
ncbi:MAG: ATP-binding protein [Deltaproteobacteria bacterium]|nr:ATP-binding protein [Deltaproteobacteria bacterium]